MMADRYTSQFKKLLPRGKAWICETGSNLYLLLEGMAAEFARIHERAQDLLLEMDPSKAVELLPEWEKVWGLPDACTGELSTLGERRAALLARIRFVGDQRPGFFIQVAASVGYTVTITENVDDDPTVWQVNAPETTVRWARAGEARAGDRIRTWGNEILECAILQVAPAHLTVLFAYGE